MTTHLVTSTVILLIAMLAARLLPLTARTRYALLFLGLVKFAIPDTAVAGALRMAGIDLQRIGAEVVPQPLRILGGGTAAPIETARASVNWLLVTWASIAGLLFLRWLILHLRTVRAAMRTSSTPSARELAAFKDAVRTLGIRTPIDIVRSTVSEAPAVVRYIRPVIVLPTHGCDDIDDVELRALLLHECAHIARHDNLLGIVEAAATALLWFNPVVHLALRQLAAAREEACDEVAVDGTRAETYLTALTKICRAAIAPRTAGASCMATAQIKQRMEHLMRYEGLKRSALSHRGVVMTMLLAALVATPLATTFATEAARPALQNLYNVTFNVQPASDKITIGLTVRNNETGKVVSTPTLSAPYGEWSETRSGEGERDILLRARGQHDGSAEVMIVVTRGDDTLQRNVITFTPPPAGAIPRQPSPQWSGEPISLQLKDAQLGDVIKTFGRITALEVDVDPAIADLVISVDVRDTPWDQALDMIARQNGLKISVVNRKLTVTKTR